MIPTAVFISHIEIKSLKLNLSPSWAACSLGSDETANAVNGLKNWSRIKFVVT